MPRTRPDGAANRPACDPRERTHVSGRGRSGLMGESRIGLYLLGGLVLVAGLAMLFFQTGLSAWIPGGIAAAGLVLILGLLIMGASDRAPEHHVESSGGGDGDLIIKK